MTSAAGTLELWDALAAAPQAARGAVVLVARGLSADLASACERPLAEASAAALDELRERGGSTLDTVIACPRCAALMEVPLELDLFADDPFAGESVVGDGGDVVVRAPTTTDLLEALATDDPAATLRERCVAWPTGADDDLRARADHAVDAAVERAVGAAGATIRVECPDCGATVSADVDVVRLLVDRVTEHAQTVLAEVAALARAYGWTESEILSIPEARRRVYLALARGGG